MPLFLLFHHIKQTFLLAYSSINRFHPSMLKKKKKKRKRRYGNERYHSSQASVHKLSVRSDVPYYAMIVEQIDV